MGNRVLKEKAQSTLETAVTLAMVVLLLMGMSRMWFWANNQIVQRQLRYNASRVAAGTSADNYTLQWPVYQPAALTEEEVLLEPER